MKIYTNTFDLRQPSEKKFWVSPHSDFKIGIKVIGSMGIDNNITATAIDLYKDDVKLTVDSTSNDMAYWKIKSEDTGEVTYTVKVKMSAQDSNYLGQFTLTQVVTNSTVFEQESNSTGDVNLDNYYTKSEINEALEDKQDKGDYVINDGNVSKIKTISQSDYDSLLTKEENTLYIITE